MKSHETLTEWLARTAKNAAQLETRTHYVYRAYDDADRLLYIGCTVDLARRMTTHRKVALWWPFVAGMETVASPTRSAARLAEEDAIRTEGSFFNRLPANQYTTDVTNASELSAYLTARDGRDVAA